ncbi:DUF434 domain-containing protein [Desulfurococcaceae archaeon MEX13E-LK6-19]|nr:DUF434 domain-containing protein [Desulfurococcaceae archaeon MEX13E-LK6-19]
MRREVIDAIHDYRFLLDRGYPIKAALDVVCTRYMLSRKERLLLYRCVHSSALARKIIRKQSIPPMKSRIVADGFNILATLYTVYCGEEVYLCDDGIVRDLSGLHSRVALSINQDLLDSLFTEIIEAVSGKEYELIIVLDYNVKKSGEIASRLRRIIKENKLDWVVLVERQADKKILEKASEGYWVSSSDIVILEKATKIYDLAGSIVREKYPRQVVKIPLEN